MFNKMDSRILSFALCTLLVHTTVATEDGKPRGKLISIKQERDSKLDPPPHYYVWNINPDADEQILNGQDGDIIEITKSINPTPQDGLITLRLRQPGTWWKAITVHNGGTYLYEAVWIQDNVIDNTVNANFEDFKLNSIVLSKAKIFGIHTDVYWIQNADKMDPTYIWDFNWIKD